MQDESAAVANPRFRHDPLKIFWWLFGVWVLLTLGARIGALLILELGFDTQTDIFDRDFANYWVGGKLVLDGRYMLLFDQSTYYPLLKSMFGADYQIHNWGYPPHFLMLCAPLGLMEYGWAMFVFLSVTFAMFVFAARAFRAEYAPDSPILALCVALFGYVLVVVNFAQNGFLTAALLLTTFAYMRRRPWLAGCALAFLTVKPQLGFLLPLLALFDRNWALLRAATAVTAGLVGISIAILGAQSWRAYFEQVMPYQQHVMEKWKGRFLAMMPTTFGSIRTLEFSPTAAYWAQLAVSVAAFALLCRLLVRLTDPLARVCALMTGTLLITPYAFNYDMGAMSVIAALVALRARVTDQPVVACTFGALAVLPAAIDNLGLAGFPLSPLLIGAAFTSLWLAARRSPVRAVPA